MLIIIIMARGKGGGIRRSLLDPRTLGSPPPRTKRGGGAGRHLTGAQGAEGGVTGIYRRRKGTLRCRGATRRSGCAAASGQRLFRNPGSTCWADHKYCQSIEKCCCQLIEKRCLPSVECKRTEGGKERQERRGRRAHYDRAGGSGKVWQGRGEGREARERGARYLHVCLSPSSWAGNSAKDMQILHFLK